VSERVIDRTASIRRNGWRFGANSEGDPGSKRQGDKQDPSGGGRAVA